MAELVAREYAEALLSVAVDASLVDQLRDEFHFVSETLEANPKLQVLLTHPDLTKAEKKDILSSIFGSRLSNQLLNLLFIIVDKGREDHIVSIQQEFSSLADEEQGIVQATAVSAIQMNEEDLSRLQEKLSMQMKKEVRLKNEVDEEILGGIKLEIGDKVYDSSVKGQLEGLKRELYTTAATMKEVKNS